MKNKIMTTGLKCAVFYYLVLSFSFFILVARKMGKGNPHVGHTKGSKGRWGRGGVDPVSSTNFDFIYLS